MSVCVCLSGPKHLVSNSALPIFFVFVYLKRWDMTILFEIYSIFGIQIDGPNTTFNIRFWVIFGN